MSDIIEVKDRIIILRDQQVILDSDVAVLYGVKTKEVNQAIANNPEKFPAGYVFELQNAEKQDVVKNFDHLEKLKFSPVMPKAFTEKGLYMLATILKSEKATKTTIEIVETYAKLRELSHTIAELSQANDEPTQKSLMQKGGEIFSELLDDGMQVSGTETSFEINFAVMKFKHTVKREQTKPPQTNE
ncbi:MAG: ORF6N domain-containing protein [Bacteroidales bacterium]|jgi:phage regulator Rha-like protein|nr:ORF6N domain-containing protein [Bacteroidales bacterium]